MTKPMAVTAAALMTLLTLSLALDAGPLPSPELSFEKNRGQAHESIDFIARGRRYASTLHAGSYSMALRTGGAGRLPRWTLSPLERFAKPPSTPWVISMYLVGANADAAAEELEPLDIRSHYRRGKDTSGWQTDAGSVIGTSARGLTQLIIRKSKRRLDQPLWLEGSPRSLRYSFMATAATA